MSETFLDHAGVKRALDDISAYATEFETLSFWSTLLPLYFSSSAYKLEVFFESEFETETQFHSRQSRSQHLGIRVIAIGNNGRHVSPAAHAAHAASFVPTAYHQPGMRIIHGTEAGTIGVVSNGGIIQSITFLPLPIPPLRSTAPTAPTATRSFPLTGDATSGSIVTDSRVVLTIICKAGNWARDLEVFGGAADPADDGDGDLDSFSNLNIEETRADLFDNGGGVRINADKDGDDANGNSNGNLNGISNSDSNTNNQQNENNGTNGINGTNGFSDDDDSNDNDDGILNQVTHLVATNRNVDGNMWAIVATGGSATVLFISGEDVGLVADRLQFRPGRVAPPPPFAFGHPRLAATGIAAPGLFGNFWARVADTTNADYADTEYGIDVERMEELFTEIIEHPRGPPLGTTYVSATQRQGGMDKNSGKEGEISFLVQEQIELAVPSNITCDD
ncbi:hypothetical protein L228DRAFT_284034 [Xylona heveae TC161]|uniref:Uncharacterized protein n=1 Tax=Xylona heveae (strain CBS 132557 / TC161) TaxID=1328760 RepID=A0A165G9Q0_XYLHT|nr:hypothetical protein L228DRAFT_284034 [Xylona heveae TC161]KZF21914.1 hypothetical protein L228DRAFT_284034 [Xylona heveae TC161]